ncbi:MULTISPECIES: lipid II:glycine glycyltransferase FemX [Atopobiaceae]|uniref:FemAB family protein n=1 Tax=Parafannyhessea umbonata TaxID=604330 RepID=A0A1H9QWG2_9ACTN|nr:MULTISPECIES: peptidoglycan bridge formation glycyltransferase FemA/FemB family protein [Atopobiaceae]SEH45063.1 FemAB family protein [Parafannyhessea umbonata]SER64824.1 FemAB family protein [Parafannyhessea umbonata]SJZ61653.1 FemAB family protein [Olsenella sp. KH1P3]
MDYRIENDPKSWNEIVESCGGHPLQAWQWGQLKSQTGPWDAKRVVCLEGGEVVGAAQVLLRTLPFPFKMMAYVPRGPLAKDPALLPEVADAIAEWCRKNTAAITVKIDPAVTELKLSDSWRKSERVLVKKTAVMDLTLDEDALNKSIPNRKCRQYIRKSARDGIVFRAATKDDLDQVLSIYHNTAEADGFALHADEFYRAAFDVMDGINQFYVAEKDGEIQAFLWNVTTKGGTAFELWGAVTDAGKRSRANYGLKWHAILDAKAKGALYYDLNGLLNDGISDFKMLFVKEPTFWIGSFDCRLKALAGLWDWALTRHRIRQSASSVQQDTSEQR